MGAGTKRECSGDGNFVNIEGNNDDNIGRNDVGGEDRGPCFPAMPRGCVACVVCRARTYLALMLVWLGLDLTSGRNRKVK